MRRFAERTGIGSDRAGRRYLWTDAFAVCNFLGLARASGDEGYLRLALRLVDRVHHDLGRHRSDDVRTGWISGASERDGEAHPTRGGLRIGKPRLERGPGEPFDESREWDRDGQYFHYLTKWMHALDQVARATGRPTYNVWARELAASAYEAFTYARPGGRRRMYWKVSIDRSRPLVTSMGHHDPLDGYITYVQLQATAYPTSRPTDGPDLAAAAEGFAGMVAETALATGDPLGIGGLLADAYRVEQLRGQGASFPDEMVERLLVAGLGGLECWMQEGDLDAPATRRLAFRELGVAIGLHGVERLERLEPRRPPYGAVLSALARLVPVGARVVAYWRDPARHEDPLWHEHRDINEVMLATALAPSGFLLLPPFPR